MDTDYNPADWDYELLQEGIQSLRLDAFENQQWGDRTPEADDKRDYYAAARALHHTADFIEYHIREGDIKSPLQTYLTEK